VDRELEQYLTTIEKYLKNMPVSERIDVIKELKSYIEELQINNALSTDKILERLGSPKDLAAGYLGEKITMGKSSSIKKMLMTFSFYSLVSLSGMFVIPCGTVFACGLMLTGIIGPIAGLIKLMGFYLGFNVPFYFMSVNGYEPHPLLAFPLSIALGILLLLSGRAIWRLIIRYIRKVSNTKRTLSNMV
jgi:uncharacterized membrane protein